jgi:hypothetical protein
MSFNSGRLGGYSKTLLKQLLVETEEGHKMPVRVVGLYPKSENGTLNYTSITISKNTRCQT